MKVKELMLELSKYNDEEEVRFIEISGEDEVSGIHDIKDIRKIEGNITDFSLVGLYSQ